MTPDIDIRHGQTRIKADLDPIEWVIIAIIIIVIVWYLLQ